MSDQERIFTDADVSQLFDLLTAAQRAGYVDMELLSTNLRLILSNRSFDRRDTLLIESDGRLEAFGLLWQGRYLGMLVHPDRRGLLEGHVLAWAERRLSSAPERRLAILCRDDDALMIEFCEQHGFDSFTEELRMGRSLDAPLPSSVVPPGFVIRPLRRDTELDAWLALYAEAFGPRESKLRHWRAMRDDPDHQPSLDLVAVSDDGMVAGMCYCAIAGLEASRGPTIEGRTEPIAVSRHCQRQGLGRALVVTGLESLRNRGAQVVALTTDVDNDVAHRLYNSLGYRERYRARWYERSEVAGTSRSPDPH